MPKHLSIIIINCFFYKCQDYCANLSNKSLNQFSTIWYILTILLHYKDGTDCGINTTRPSLVIATAHELSFRYVRAVT